MGLSYFIKKIIINSPKYGQREVLVDDHWIERIKQYKWFISKKEGKPFYAVRHEWKNNKQKTISMHRQILGLTDPNIKGDHIDHDGLNNQEKNLRKATHAQNTQNQRPTRGCKFIGVTFDKARNKWTAYIKSGNTTYRIGRFDKIEDAAHARDLKARELFGEFAYINLPHLISA